LKNAAKSFPLTLSMVHLLHRLYGVDAPAISNTQKIFLYIWMNLTFSLTGSHKSACISSHI